MAPYPDIISMAQCFKISKIKEKVESNNPSAFEFYFYSYSSKNTFIDHGTCMFLTKTIVFGNGNYFLICK